MMLGNAKTVKSVTTYKQACKPKKKKKGYFNQFNAKKKVMKPRLFGTKSEPIECCTSIQTEMS
jgi:hypothetical protein